MTEIDQAAPVVGSSEIEIAARPEIAWEVLTSIEQWPSWNPGVKEASLAGPVEEGSEFRWKAGPGTITSTIRQVEAGRRIVWTGNSMGISAIHVHTFEARNGGTLVTTQESYDGVVARLFRGRLKRTLDRALHDGLQRLKAEAERREN